MDPHPERASDPVTEENIFQFLHLPSEHRRDCKHGHCWAGIVNQIVVCRSTSSEQLNTPLTRQSQSNCWIYQTGSGSFSCKLENKVSSSTFPKPSNIPYSNKDMIIHLSSCSVHFKHLVQWEPWCRLDLRWNGRVSSTPFPFFLLGNYWYARPVFHKP